MRAKKRDNRLLARVLLPVAVIKEHRAIVRLAVVKYRVAGGRVIAGLL